jgi:transcriptional regulator of acetoin/glycerol metabolism
MLETLASLSGGTPPALTTDLIESAMKRPWLRNLDELHIAAEVLMNHSPTSPLSAGDLTAVTGSNSSKTGIMPLEAVVKEHIRGVLLECKGNKYQAARALGISRSTLHRMIKNRSLDLPATTSKGLH